MSEFSIDRPPKTTEPSRSVDSSNATDADGGGAFTFLFHGGGGNSEEKPKEPPKKSSTPLPIGPPVALNLSSVARMDLGAEAVPGDFGVIGSPVTPPTGISEFVQKNLEAIKTLDENAVDPSLLRADGRLDIKA